MDAAVAGLILANIVVGLALAALAVLVAILAAIAVSFPDTRGERVAVYVLRFLFVTVLAYLLGAYVTGRWHT